MKRAAFDDDIPLPPRGRAPVAEASKAVHLCRYCGDETPYETMATLGARCGRCYAAYCAVLPRVPYVDEAAAVPAGTPDSLKWAYRLRWRHRNGDTLTRAQIESYQQVLKRFDMEAQ